MTIRRYYHDSTWLASVRQRNVNYEEEKDSSGAADLFWLKNQPLSFDAVGHRGKLINETRLIACCH